MRKNVVGAHTFLTIALAAFIVAFTLFNDNCKFVVMPREAVAVEASLHIRFYVFSFFNSKNKVLFFRCSSGSRSSSSSRLGDRRLHCTDSRAVRRQAVAVEAK